MAVPQDMFQAFFSVAYFVGLIYFFMKAIRVAVDKSGLVAIYYLFFRILVFMVALSLLYMMLDFAMHVGDESYVLGDFGYYVGKIVDVQWIVDIFNGGR